jgi:flagella basal body P-ring formation protein FlgA
MTNFLRFCTRIAVLCSLLAVALPCRHAPAADDPSRVTVELRPTVTVDHTLLTVADVADVRGGDVGLRRRIAQLDLAELAPAPSREELRQSRVGLRLFLAGIAETQIRLCGAATTVVSFEHRVVNDQQIIEALQSSLSALWNVPPEALLIRLSQPLDQSLPKDFKWPADPRLTPFLGPDEVPGRQRISLGVHVGDQLVQTISVPVDVQLEMAVAIATRDLAAGDPITPDAVRFERRRLVGAKAIRTASHDVLGKFVLQPIRAGQLMEKDQLTQHRPDKATAAGAANGPQVRSQAIVSVVARRKNLRVVFHNAQLLSTARVGETVRVRNMESNRVLVGRLISTTEVEITF